MRGSACRILRVSVRVSECVCQRLCVPERMCVGVCVQRLCVCVSAFACRSVCVSVCASEFVCWILRVSVCVSECVCQRAGHVCCDVVCFVCVRV